MLDNYVAKRYFFFSFKSRTVSIIVAKNPGCPMYDSRVLTRALGGGPLGALCQGEGGGIGIGLQAALLADAPHAAAQHAGLARGPGAARVVALDPVVVRQHRLLRLVPCAHAHVTRPVPTDFSLRLHGQFPLHQLFWLIQQTPREAFFLHAP